MTAYGVAQPVEVGDIVVRPGDVDYDLMLVESGWIEILSPAIGDEPESVVARYGSGMFLGELNFLTGQTAYLMARVSEAARIHRISRGRFRRLMATEPDLSDILLRTFFARRDLLREGPAARAIAIVGSELWPKVWRCVPSPPVNAWPTCGWTPTVPQDRGWPGPRRSPPRICPR